MAEYYGYAERDANAYVDWGKLGQNLTETVQAAYALREKRKKDLDDIMEQNYNDLVNAPSGLNKDINKTITDHVSNTKQFLLRANKLLKSGILRPEDYTLIMQNQKEDNNAIFQNAKNWQDAWAKIQDDVKNGKGSRAMLDLASETASFGKFNNMDFMINPVTGRVNASKMIIDANGDRIKGESMTMQQLNVLMNQNIDKYDLTSHLANVESIVGENVVSNLVKARIRSQGSITNIADKSTKDSFEDAYATFAKEIVSNPVNSMSILMDYQGRIPKDDEIDAMLKAKPPLITQAEADEMRRMAGESYIVSTNPNDYGKPNVIYYQDKVGDGSFEPKLTDAQSKVVDKFIRDQFIGLIDHKEEKAVVQAVPDDFNLGRANYNLEQQRAAEIGRQMGLLTSGTEDDKRKAVAFFTNQRKSDGSYVFKDVKLDDQGNFTLEDTKGNKLNYNIKGNSKLNSGMQVFSAFENAYGEGKTLSRDIFRKEMMNAGSKDIVLPSTGVVIQSTLDLAAPAANPANGTIDAGQYNKPK